MTNLPKSLDHSSAHDLIQAVQVNDRRFRLAVNFLLTILLVGVGFLVFLQYQTLSEFTSQSKERSAGLKTLSEQNRVLSEENNRYVKCIAIFLSQSNRTEKKLSSIEDCDIDKQSNGDPSTGTSAPSRTTTPGESQSQNLTPGSAQTEPNSPSPGSSPLPQDPDTNTNPNPDPPRGVIPRLLDGAEKVADRVRDIIGL